MDLHVFFDDYEWYIAESIDEAKAFQREFGGCSIEDQECSDWHQVLDDREMRIWLDPDTGDVSAPCDGAIFVSGSCEAWAESYGPGFLASTEY